MTVFGVRSRFSSPAARRIEAAGAAFQRRRPAGRAPAPPCQIVSDGAAFGPKLTVWGRDFIRARGLAIVVADKHGLTLDDLRAESRCHALVGARMHCMYVLVVEHGISQPVAGAVLRRDHSTVASGVKRYARKWGLPCPLQRKRKP